MQVRHQQTGKPILRFQDLVRHAITELAESAASKQTTQGHVTVNFTSKEKEEAAEPQMIENRVYVESYGLLNLGPSKTVAPDCFSATCEPCHGSKLPFEW